MPLKVFFHKGLFFVFVFVLLVFSGSLQLISRLSHQQAWKQQEKPWLTLAGEQKLFLLAAKWGFPPLNHNKQTCKTCRMFPDNNHETASAVSKAPASAL